MKSLMAIALFTAMSGVPAPQDEAKKGAPVYVFHLRKAKATDLEPLLTRLIQALGAKPGATEPTLVADGKANVLVLVADAEIRKAIEAIIAKIDQEAAEAKAGAPQEMTIAELLQSLGSRLGRRFMYGRELALDHKRVMIPPIPENATPPELQALLEAVLKSQYLFLLQSEGAATLYTVEQSPLMSKKGVPVLGAADAIPAGDAVYTKSFKLKGPRDAQAMFINMVSFPQCCLSNEAAGVLLITDYASNLRRFEKIVASLQ